MRVPRPAQGPQTPPTPCAHPPSPLPKRKCPLPPQVLLAGVPAPTCRTFKQLSKSFPPSPTPVSILPSPTHHRARVLSPLRFIELIIALQVPANTNISLTQRRA
ncbi:hypothetical protein M405DRAFT_812355 [Rhizopogon salebrosus TDB-379]|nr:hypothetical protein M405DRAFT_812355 [Rhizopogon salebrosus TDB-379]